MLSSPRTATADRPPQSAAEPRRTTTAERRLPVERQCPHCCAEVAQEAKKCRWCGEWVVGTSAGPAAAMLRLLSWCWMAGSLVAAAGTWFGITSIRARILAQAVEPIVARVVLDSLAYGVTAFVLLQGVTIAVGLRVLANSAPRRPRWWTRG